MLAGGQSSHLLVIGAYRNNDQAAVQPLLLTFDDLRKAGVPVNELALAPLTLDHIVALLGDTLRLDAAAVRPLAEILLRKTDGSPFFLQQFLTALHEQKLLQFDAERGRWTWINGKVEAAVASDNVVDLLVARIRRLSDTAREALTLGACIGQEFDLGTLSQISERTGSALMAGIMEALREGLLTPLDARSRFLAESPSEDDEISEVLVSYYRFLHDRVRQAAYDIVDAEQRGRAHAKIGRLLLAQAGTEPSDDRLVQIVRHMNLGLTSITDAAERRTLARFNLRAGIKVAGSGAHAAAVELLRRCLELLGPNAWADDHATTYRAHLTLAECEFMSGNVAGALQLLDVVDAKARTTLERVAGREIRIIALSSNASRLIEAVDCGVETARMLGADFPADDAQLGPAIGAELGALKAMLAGRTVESLLEMPEMADPEKRALVDVLFKTNASAFMSKPQASVLIGLKAVRLAIEHGNAPKSPYFYGNYGIINNATGGALDVSYRFAKLGIDLVDKAGYTEIEGATHFLFGAFNCHWRRPLSESLDHLRHAVKAALEAGAYLHVAWAAMIVMYYRFYRGENIQELLADLPQTMDLLRRSENPAAQTILRVFERNLLALSGQTGNPTSLDGDGFDEAAFAEGAKGHPRAARLLPRAQAADRLPRRRVPAVARARRDGVAVDAGHVLRHRARALSHPGADRLARRGCRQRSSCRPRAPSQGRGDLPRLGGSFTVESCASPCAGRGGDCGAGRRTGPRDRSLRSRDQAGARERVHPARGARQRARREVPPAASARPGRARLHARGLVRVPPVGCKRQGEAAGRALRGPPR
jgi:predicted ATPase